MLETNMMAFVKRYSTPLYKCTVVIALQQPVSETSCQRNTQSVKHPISELVCQWNVRLPT